MFKKIILLLFLLIVGGAFADEMANNFILMNNYNVRQYDDIWQRIRAGFKLDHTENSRIRYFEKMYTRNPRYFSLLMNNAKPYLYYLLTEIERRGMPSELIFIPGIESSYNPLVTRPDDHYAGMWQFVPLTGRRFNLLQNSTIDERRDIIKSSKSALSYLNYLYLIFKQWDVAIGAYNWGEGNMYKAVIATGEPLGHVVYTDLRVRQITADYELKIIALANIINDPARFGVKLDDAPNTPYFAVVHPESATTIANLMQVAKVDRHDFARLNSQYKNQDEEITAANKVLLPLSNQTIYYASLGKNLDSAMMQVATDTTSTASSDDDLADDPILQAANFSKSADEPVSYSPKDTAKALAQLDDLVNNIDSNDDVVSQGKIVPANRYYVVNNGDTLYSIARKFNISVNELKLLNKLNNNNIVVGQKILLND